MKRFGLFLFALVAGCTTDTGKDSTDADAERVFGVSASGTASASTLTGIWESTSPTKSGTLEQLSRLELRDSFVVFAARCTMSGQTPVTVGGRAAATVSAQLVEIQGSINDIKSIGNAECGVTASAGSLPACTAEQSSVCFELTGSGLNMHQGQNGTLSYKKISD